MNAALHIDDEAMDLEQAAAFLHLGLESTRALVHSGAIAALSLNQKHIVILRSVLIDYVRTEGSEQAQVRRSRRGRKTDPQGPAPRRQAPRSTRQPLPDLSRYEVTTSARPGSSHADSSNA